MVNQLLLQARKRDSIDALFQQGAITKHFNTISGSNGPDLLKEFLAMQANAARAGTETLPEGRAGTILGDLKAMAGEETKVVRPGMFRRSGSNSRPGQRG